jgi:hypothetical protein
MPVKLAKISGKLSGILFFISLSIGRSLDFIPLKYRFIFEVISISICLIAQFFWLISNVFQPDPKPSPLEQCYELMGIKNQYIASALLGILASILFYIAIPYTSVLIASGWLYFIANSIWTSAEYKKLKDPPNCDKNFSIEEQRPYTIYSIGTTLMSLSTAITLTIIIANPAIMATTLAISTIIGFILGASSAAFWLDSKFSDNSEESYSRMSSKLGVNKTPELIATATTSPSLFINNTPRSSEEELIEIKDDQQEIYPSLTL